jgi:hypothetical protein
VTARLTGAILLIALAAPAAACRDDEPRAKTVPLSESAEGKAMRDSESSAAAASEAVAKKAAAAAALDEAATAATQPAPAASGEVELEPGKVWLTVPGIGVDVGVSPQVAIAKAAGGEVVLSDGTDELRLRRAGDGAWDRDAIVDRLAKRAGGPVGVVVDRAEPDDTRLEYLVKDRKSGKPVYGLVMRRQIDGRAIECASRGSRTNSTFMALEACRRMRATPP